MIDKIYIDEAIRIRTEYLNNLIYITNEEDNIKKLIVNLEDLKEAIEDSEQKDENFYKDSLYKVESMLTEATTKLTPFNDKITQLDDEQRTLYNNIKEKYVNLTDDEIKGEIIPEIVKVDETFKHKYNK